jgi:ubiquinone/menaquinone biosynthesis C-methylase UbiE
MKQASAQWHPAVVRAYDFSKFSRIVDVGGGQGTLITLILKNHPHLRGVIFDSPSVIEGARQRIEEAGLSGRCEVIAGDFFEAVPAGGDVYILSVVIHDWDDERRCRDSEKLPESDGDHRNTPAS